MVTEPDEMPATMPVEEPTDPIEGLLLLHVPPEEPSDNLVVDPIHALSVPKIGCMAFTVIPDVT